MDEVMTRILTEAPEAGESSTTSAESSADVINAQVGSLPDYDCGKCRNKGFIAYTRGGALLTRECSCMPVRRSVRRIRRSGLSGLLERYTFSSYETPEEWQRRAEELAVRFCDERREMAVRVRHAGNGENAFMHRRVRRAAERRAGREILPLAQ